MPENTVRFESSARVRARHALFVHDAADASPGRGDALPFQGGLDSSWRRSVRGCCAGPRVRRRRSNPRAPSRDARSSSNRWSGDAQYPALR